MGSVYKFKGESFKSKTSSIILLKESSIFRQFLFLEILI